MKTVNADYFDGKSARVHRVRLTLSDGALLLEGEDIQRRDPLESLRVSEPMGAAPRLIKFPDGAHCEVSDHAELSNLLRAGGHRDSLVVQLQSHWRWALMAMIITLAGIAAGYRWGLPAVAEWIAFKLPDKALAQVGESTLAFLDKGVMMPSELPRERQKALRTAFEKLSAPDDKEVGHEVVFRNGKAIGANAFALPDGTIVVTDQLVSLAKNDQEILGVLAHELGHLKRRHSLRMLIQGSIVAFGVAWYLGDVSSVAAGFPTLLLQARYSRDHEREADDYAAAMLNSNGISPSRLAELLSRMEEAYAARQKNQGEPDANFGGYLDSHPATSERIKALESE